MGPGHEGLNHHQPDTERKVGEPRRINRLLLPYFRLLCDEPHLIVMERLIHNGREHPTAVDELVRNDVIPRATAFRHVNDLYSIGLIENSRYGIYVPTEKGELLFSLLRETVENARPLLLLDEILADIKAQGTADPSLLERIKDLLQSNEEKPEEKSR